MRLLNHVLDWQTFFSVLCIQPWTSNSGLFPVNGAINVHDETLISFGIVFNFVIIIFKDIGCPGPPPPPFFTSIFEMLFIFVPLKTL